jgi:hypothetical protein
MDAFAIRPPQAAVQARRMEIRPPVEGQAEPSAGLFFLKVTTESCNFKQSLNFKGAAARRRKYVIEWKYQRILEGYA